MGSQRVRHDWATFTSSVLDFKGKSAKVVRANIASTSNKVFLQGSLYYRPLLQVRTQVQKGHVNDSRSQPGMETPQFAPMTTDDLPSQGWGQYLVMQRQSKADPRKEENLSQHPFKTSYLTVCNILSKALMKNLTQNWGLGFLIESASLHLLWLFNHKLTKGMSCMLGTFVSVKHKFLNSNTWFNVWFLLELGSLLTPVSFHK